MSSLTAVEPILDKETTDYINSVENQKGQITKEEIKEYIQYSIKDGDKELFANFIAIIDRLKRNDKRFQRISGLHVTAIKADDQYNKMYKEVTKEGSELSNMTSRRHKWNKENQS